MGCHTWFYRKIDKPSVNEAKQFVINKLNKDLKHLNKSIVKLDDMSLVFEYRREILVYEKALKVFDVEDDELLDSIKDNSEFIPLWLGIEDEDPLNVLYFTYSHYQEELTEYVNGNLYEEIDDYHDAFRTYYDDTKLFSYDDCVEYIKNNVCDVYDNTYEQLKRFWEEYPDGLITFG